MPRTTLEEMKARRLAGMTADERHEFENAYSRTKLAIEVGEKVRTAREQAGMTQRALTTLQKAAAALDLQISVELHATDV